MTISCSLGPQLKDEALSIEIKLLLNTEILKRVSRAPTNPHTLGLLWVYKRAWLSIEVNALKRMYLLLNRPCFLCVPAGQLVCDPVYDQRTHPGG